MKQYLTLLQDILDKGTWKAPARENLPPTLSLFGTRMEFDMEDGFPLLTTKEVYFKGIVVELLWFLRGDTNIKYLVDNGCNVWNEDAYKWYLKCLREKNHLYKLPQYEILLEDFVSFIRNHSEEEVKRAIKIKESNYKMGDLGKVYGYQWRDRDGIDQIQTILNRLQSEPEGRYAILDAWNPADFSEMALPPCHLLYQFNCRKLTSNEREFIWLQSQEQYIVDQYEESIRPTEELLNLRNIPKYYLDLQLYQRSCDTFLGVPFNIASGALLLHIIAQILGMEPGKFIWVGGDTHIYENHMEQVKEQLSRTPTELPKLKFWWGDDPLILKNLVLFGGLSWEDFKLEGYKPQAKIKAELNVGLKK